MLYRYNIEQQFIAEETQINISNTFHLIPQNYTVLVLLHTDHSQEAIIEMVTTTSVAMALWL